VLVLNLIPQDAEDFAHMLAPIRQVFPLCTACLSVPTQHNVLVFAFREALDCAGLESRIPALTQQWGLPFAEFLQRMRSENPTGSGVF
jgi:NADH:ubiquinone oxidoreductase subunit H